MFLYGVQYILLAIILDTYFNLKMSFVIVIL